MAGQRSAVDDDMPIVVGAAVIILIVWMLSTVFM